jgi:two-component system cell cycle response regulator CtrA
MGPILNAVAAYATLPPAIIEVGAIRLNVESKTVEVNGQRVHLTSMEYELLERLALRKGVTLTKEMILNHLYGGMDREPKFKIINVFVCKLRKKLCAATGGPHYIETVWGRGYMLRDPAEQSY